ncbi:hypothetical protein M434DRAFT_385026, partial [Hypoxylon sp. CO27-5]
VLGLPSGHETGEYVTIDLGGTNLRLCTLKGQHEEIDIKQRVARLPPTIKTGDAETLWNFVVGSLDEFLKTHRLIANREDRYVLLQFYTVSSLRDGRLCFSFPASQDYIHHGKLKTWTKGFDIDGVEGEDAASQLRDALAKRNLPLELVALVNDTTEAMVASAYKDPDTIIGAIFGTGCNAAYVENQLTTRYSHGN